jgi:ribosome biogenesis GTPase
VTRSTGSWYDVRADDGRDLRARIRGRFRLDALLIDETNPLAVGDRVSLALDDDEVGLITGIHPRQNQLSRRASGRKAAIREHVIVVNVDRAWCVQSTFGPKLNAGFVDRFLVAAEMSHVPAGLIINKADLLDGNARAQEAMDFWTDLYSAIGYPVLLTSAETEQGVDELREALGGRVSVVSGPSGVGKSSLLNRVQPGLGLKTAGISDKTQKGRHTTTFATLHEVAGGWVADTPGIREFGLWDLAPVELGGYFAEFRPFIPDCRFPDCTHVHEPGCAVQQAVDAGEITQERYGSYLVILETVQTEYEEARRMRWRTTRRPDETVAEDDA